MARGRKQREEIRAPMELSKNLPFERICNEHPEYDFIIVNDAKGSVQRHEMKGWRVFKGASVYDSEFERLTGKTNKDEERETLASVPCGLAGEGKPTRAYLMFAPAGTIAKANEERHNENARRQSSYDETIKQRAASISGADIRSTFTPSGFEGGFKDLPDTVSQSQS